MTIANNPANATSSLEHQELVQLLELLCEDRLDVQQATRLEELVLVDPAGRTLYLEYISLHGTLYWDAARAGVEESEVAAVGVVTGDHPATSGTNRRVPRRLTGLAVLLTSAAVVIVAVGLAFRPGSPADATGLAGTEDSSGFATSPGTGVVASPTAVIDSATRQPMTISAAPGSQLSNRVETRDSSPGTGRETLVDPGSSVPKSSASVTGSGSLAEIVGFVDDRLASGWQDNEIAASGVASDSEWLRRVYLDIVGHIPPASEVLAFLKDRRLEKRSEMIERLLDDSDYIRHSTTVWSNLLVGRGSRREVNRAAFEKFLRESFARNRPWNEVVGEMVSAGGRNDENGATNFLLAHLNNDATPATAITARLFLGTQVQCTQCHNHPFNDWRQEQFHGLTAFFKSTRSERVRGSDAFELISGSFDGSPYYEDRRGVLHMASAGLGARRVDLKGVEEPRVLLAKLMTSGEDSRLARAMVNRTWARLLGHGFTSPVDDMGPHNPPSHPEVLDRLAQEFETSGFDVKQLVRWICNTRAYGLTSRMTDGNSDDDPATGSQPLFSRVYTKPMSVEQLYDSLLVATWADRITADDWESVAGNRRRWQSQFVHSFETDENDEAVTFAGTITQAMMMMNGPLIQDALSQQPGSYFHQIVHSRGSDIDRVKRLCLSALGRFPTSSEMAAIQKMLPLRPTGQARQTPASGPLADGLQDVFWAYLNSNEFVTIP